MHGMYVSLLYFDGCPNWRTTDERLRQALDRVGHGEVRVAYGKVTTDAEAQAVAFRGSPTVIVDGRDPFLDQESPVGLSCRMYRTSDGLAGSPTVDQLVEVLR